MSKKNKELNQEKDSEETKDSDKGKPEGELSFMGHLEELRNRIIWSIVGLVVACIISGIFIDKILEYAILALPIIACLL